MIPLLLAVAMTAPVPQGHLVDRVVAVVVPGGRAEHRTLITLSDLELEARVALIRAGALGAAKGNLPPDTLAAALEQLIAQELIAAEAEDLAVVRIEPEELRVQLAAFASSFPSTEAYRSFLEHSELTEPELTRILRRDVLVERYLASRSRLSVSVSEAELQRAYAREPPAPGVTLESARSRLLARLEKQKREELVSALVSDLRSRGEVRVLFDVRQGREP